MKYYGIGVNSGQFGHDRGMPGREMVQDKVVLADEAGSRAHDLCDVSPEVDGEKGAGRVLVEMESNLH